MRSTPNAGWGTSLCLAAAAGIIFALSQSATYGDAPVYAGDILSDRLLEAGHLLWRPLGRLIRSSFGGGTGYSGTLWILQGISLAASVLSVLSLHRLTARIAPGGVGWIIPALMAISNGYWTYSFSGCAYSLSVLWCILALGHAIADDRSPVTAKGAFLAGVFGGLSAATWGLQVIVAPALWLLVVANHSNAPNTAARVVKHSVAIATGYGLTFLIPLVAAYELRIRNSPADHAIPFKQWLSTSNHGVSTHFGLTQVLRALIGWPQSFASISDLGQQLRLWHFHELKFPLTAWLMIPIAFYVLLAAGAVRALPALSRLGARGRIIFGASALALLINLIFAALWQGSDLERFFPSLPFQMLMLALILGGVDPAAGRGTIRVIAVAGLLVLATLNCSQIIAPVWSPQSFRQTWLRTLEKEMRPQDLIVVFEKRVATVVAPHDSNMPGIENVAEDIVLDGSGWSTAAAARIARTLQQGGRVYLADSLFDAADVQRTGWSFAEFPAPPATEIRDRFLPLKSPNVAFVVGDEKVWTGEPGRFRP